MIKKTLGLLETIKKACILGNPVWIFMFILLLNLVGSTGFTDRQDHSLDEVKGVLESLKTALREEDESAIEDILATTKATQGAAKSELARIIVKVLSQRREMKEAEEMWKKMQTLGGGPHQYLDYIINSSFIHFEETDESAGYPAIKVWLREPEGRSGFVVFLEQNGKLLWHYESTMAAFVDGILSWARNPYDFSTPTKAFQSLREAQSLGDTFAIYSALASDLKQDVTFEEYNDHVKLRKGQRAPLYYNTENLQEKLLEPKLGKQRCKIEKLNEDGKQVGSEVFVKEGREWKWIPDSKYRWYPAKQE